MTTYREFATKKRFLELLHKNRSQLIIYEDEKFVLFVHDEPRAIAHIVLGVKTWESELYELSGEGLTNFWRLADHYARRMTAEYGKKTNLDIFRNEVPMAHVHLMVTDEKEFTNHVLELSYGQLSSVAERLRDDGK